MSYTSKQAARESHAAEQQGAKPSAQLFSDQRTSTSVQLKQQHMMGAVQRMGAEEEEPLQGKFATLQRAEEEELLQGKFATAQLMEEEEPIQGKFDTLQRAGVEEEEPLQGKFNSTAPAQLEQKPNNTGLPDNLKSGIENMSGYSMDDVKVHYNSDKPAQLNAHAYAQGTDIHVAPGQEQHLPHEAWHVVQQKQGRVQPTMQMKAGVPVNDDAGLENEADVMGARALHNGLKPSFTENATVPATDTAQNKIVQRALPPGQPDTKNFYNARKDKSTKKPYTGGRPTDFSTSFKANLMEHLGAVEDESGLYHIMTPGSGVAVLPSNAIQIDHITPWKDIETHLTGNYAPSNLKSTLLADAKGNYTVYAARMYYHDVGNLRPMAPSDNASKGASKVSTGAALADELKTAIQKMSANMHDIAREGEAAHGRVLEKKVTKKQKESDVAALTEEVSQLESPMVDAYNNIIDIGS